MENFAQTFMNGMTMNRKPSKSSITEKSIGNGREWEIPAKKGVGCMMIFGFFFCIPPLIILIASINDVMSGSDTAPSGWEMLGIVAFLSVFLLVGGSLFYFGYKMSRTTYKIKVIDGAVEVLKLFAQKEKVEKLEKGNVQGVGLYSNSETNGKADYGLVAKAREGDDIRLLSGFKEDELRWLASEMLASLSEQGGLPSEEETEEMYFNDHGGGGGDVAYTSCGSSTEVAKVADFAKHGVKISLLRNEEFVIEKKGTVIGKSMLFGGLIGVVFSSVFIGIGFWADDGPWIFGVVGIIFASISFLIFIIGLTKLGTGEKFTFKVDRIVKEKLRGGVSKSKTSYEKSIFQKLKAKSSGSSNGTSRYSVELIGGPKPLKLFSWVDGDVTNAVKLKVNQWLKPEAELADVETESDSSSMSGYMSAYGSAMTVEKTQETHPVQTLISPSDVPVYQSLPNLKNVKGGKWMLRIFLLVFLSAGMGMLIFGVSNIMMAKDSETWPSVEGKILESKISVNHSDDSTTYGADVSYEFRVGDLKYKGDKVTISEVSTSSRNRAKKIVKRYPKRKKVPVFYDPNDPERNVLEPGLSGASWLMPGLGLVFFAIPFYILIHTERARRKEAKKNLPSRNSLGNLQSRYGKMK